MQVILYTQPNCPQCKMIHMLMDKKKISYEECQDIELMKQLKITHTPTLSIDGELFSGAELKSKINELEAK